MRITVTPAPAPDVAAVIAAAVQAVAATAAAQVPTDSGSAWHRQALVEGVAGLHTPPASGPSAWRAALMTR